MPMLKVLPQEKNMKEIESQGPKKETINFLLNFSKSLEVLKTSKSDPSENILIHLN